MTDQRRGRAEAEGILQTQRLHCWQLRQNRRFRPSQQSHRGEGELQQTLLPGPASQRLRVCHTQCQGRLHVQGVGT